MGKTKGKKRMTVKGVDDSVEQGAASTGEEAPGELEEEKLVEEEVEFPQTEEVAELEDVEALRQALQKEKEKAEEYLDQWRRAAADFANFRRRSQQEREELVKLANAGLITRLLPVLDDLERASQTVPSGLGSLTWIEGIYLIDRKLRLTLEQEGLVPIETDGQLFDPTLHQAVVYEESEEHEEGHIMAELQKGYKLNDRVLRPALVKVAKAAEGSEEPEKPSQGEENS